MSMKFFCLGKMSLTCKAAFLIFTRQKKVLINQSHIVRAKGAGQEKRV